MNYLRITADYYNDVISHLRKTFFADEPLNKSLSLCQPGQGHKELEEHSMATMKDGGYQIVTFKTIPKLIVTQVSV
jgi:hypothetical protein